MTSPFCTSLTGFKPFLGLHCFQSKWSPCINSRRAVVELTASGTGERRGASWSASRSPRTLHVPALPAREPRVCHSVAETRDRQRHAAFPKAWVAFPLCPATPYLATETKGSPLSSLSNPNEADWGLHFQHLLLPGRPRRRKGPNPKRGHWHLNVLVWGLRGAWILGEHRE